MICLTDGALLTWDMELYVNQYEQDHCAQQISIKPYSVVHINRNLYEYWIQIVPPVSLLYFRVVDFVTVSEFTTPLTDFSSVNRADD